MADQKDGNDHKTGVLEDLKEKSREFGEIVKTKTQEQLEELKKPQETQLYRSIFRIKHDEEPRNRALFDPQ